MRDLLPRILLLYILLPMDKSIYLVNSILCSSFIFNLGLFLRIGFGFKIPKIENNIVHVIKYTLDL